MTKRKSNPFISGALTLTIAAIVIKILSAVYRIPFQNIVGDIGFYIYQQVYPIYGAAVVIATYGFPVVISKMSVDRKKKSGEKAVQRMLVIAAAFLFMLGAAAFFIFYFGAERIASSMDDPQLAQLIRIISFVFLIIPFTAVCRGYFQSLGDMNPTAYSQLGEQTVRVGTILICAAVLVDSHDLYTVGAGAVFGSITGAAAACIIMAYYIRKKVGKSFKTFLDICKSVQLHEAASIAKVLLIQGFAVCASSLLLIFMQLADSFNLFSLLISSGMNGEDAKELKGVFDRGQPLLQLGSVAATAMSLSLVPLIANRQKEGEKRKAAGEIKLAVRLSIAVGLGASAGLISIIRQTNMMLFENTSGSDVLLVLSWAILLSSVIITIISILQGMGHMMFPAFVVLSGLFLKYSLNIIFVPRFGTMGAAIATNAALVFILVILFAKLLHFMGQPLVSISFLIKTGFGAAVMFIVLKGYLFMTGFMYDVSHERLAASFQAMTGVLIGGAVYLFIIIRLKCFTLRELVLLPFGSRLLLFYPKR